MKYAGGLNIRWHDCPLHTYNVGLEKKFEIPSDRRMLGRGWGKCESGKRIL